MRNELKDGNKLPLLLDTYRHKRLMTQFMKELMWVGLSDFCYHLSKRHYGEPQKTHVKGEITEAHQVRMDTILEFILESDLKIPIKGVIFSIHRRYAWIELLVELKLAGVAYLEGMSTTKKVNSAVTKDIIEGLKIERKLSEENYGRIPTESEIIVEYTRQLLDKGKTVNYASLERLLQRYSTYRACKNRTNTLSFDEAFYKKSESSDSV
jgi:hypothetical protein